MAQKGGDMIMKTEDFIKNITQEGARKPFPAPYKVILIWILTIIVYFSALLTFYGFRPDIAEKITGPAYLFEIIIMFITMILSICASAWLALPDINQKSWIRFIPLITFSFLIIVLLYGVITNGTVSLTECLRVQHYDCIILVVMYSLIPGGIIFYTMQKAASLHSSWAGAMAGLAASSSGYILLRLIEESDDPGQLIVWHVLPVIFVMFISMILGKSYLCRI